MQYYLSFSLANEMNMRLKKKKEGTKIQLGKMEVLEERLK